MRTLIITQNEYEIEINSDCVLKGDANIGVIQKMGTEVIKETVKLRESVENWNFKQ